MKRLNSIFLVTRLQALRLIERCLPISVLRVILAPLIWLPLKHSEADVDDIRANEYRWLPLKRSQPDVDDIRAIYESRMDLILLGFSKRLMEERWSKRCKFTASNAFKNALARQERAVLLFLHEGPLPLLPQWLRAFGVKASIFVASDSSNRQPHQRWRDLRVRFPDQKIVWHRNELRGCINLLSTGGILLMAVDSNLGKQTTVEMDDGRTFRLASGPLRLAQRTGCAIFPCGLESLGGWSFRLRIGDKHTEASSKLIEDLLDCYQTNGYSDRVLSRFSPPDVV